VDPRLCAIGSTRCVNVGTGATCNNELTGVAAAPERDPQRLSQRQWKRGDRRLRNVRCRGEWGVPPVRAVWTRRQDERTAPKGPVHRKGSEHTEDKHERTHAPAGSRWILGLEFVDLATVAFLSRLCILAARNTPHGDVIRRPGQLREFRDFASLPCERFAFSTPRALPPAYPLNMLARRHSTAV